jgi:hypothetical protein
MIDPTMPTLLELDADLAVSEAELAAGDVVSGEEIAAEVQGVLARLQAKPLTPCHRKTLSQR